MAVLKNHPRLETGQVFITSFDVPVLHTQVKETRGEFKMLRSSLTTRHLSG